MVATINLGCVVEGPFGPLLSAEATTDGSQKRKRAKRAVIEGKVLEARGGKTWLVEFSSTGERKLCSSTSLTLVKDPRYDSNNNNSTIFSGAVTTLGIPSVSDAATSPTDETNTANTTTTLLANLLDTIIATRTA
jgi:hypothetical protein